MSEQTTTPEQKAGSELVKSETMDSLHHLFKQPKPIRTFTIVDPDGTESGQYHGRTPRQAALKAIKEVDDGVHRPTTIKLRERGTKKLHIFKGYVEVVPVPEKRPVWMKAGTMMKVAHVEKVGIEKVK